MVVHERQRVGDKVTVFAQEATCLFIEPYAWLQTGPYLLHLDSLVLLLKSQEMYNV